MASILLKESLRLVPRLPLNSLSIRCEHSLPKSTPNQVSSLMSGGLPFAVGLSLGMGGLGLLLQSDLLNKKTEEKPVVQSIEPKLIEEYISMALKVNQLENQYSKVIEIIRDRDQELSKITTPTPRGDIDVFELSQVLEANNMAYTNKHRRELDEQRRALTKQHSLQVEGEILKVENKYRPALNRIRELEAYLEAQSQTLKKEAPSRVLWVSCQALLNKLRFEQQGPLEDDPAYEVLKRFATAHNSLAIKVLDALPAKALKEGIQSEESLIDRFKKVEKLCKRVALVGDNGGGITKYLVSYLQSLFVIDNIKVSEDEVTGKQLVDPTSWHTYDILARVRYCLTTHNLEQAVRYANQLRGQARVVARDWIRDARVHLETRQAFSVLSTYAEAVAIETAFETFVK